MDEHAKLLKEIEDERLKLQEEKARNEIAKTLNSRNADDSGRSRVEIDAAVKYAEVNIPICNIFSCILMYLMLMNELVMFGMQWLSVTN